MTPPYIVESLWFLVGCFPHGLRPWAQNRSLSSYVFHFNNGEIFGGSISSLLPLYHTTTIAQSCHYLLPLSANTPINIFKIATITLPFCTLPPLNRNQIMPFSLCFWCFPDAAFGGAALSILIVFLFSVMSSARRPSSHSPPPPPPGSRGLPLIGETIQFMAAVNSSNGVYDFVRIRCLR